jgi:GTP-dependent phosphoenolpyruvate carboxykinase
MCMYVSYCLTDFVSYVKHTRPYNTYALNVNVVIAGLVPGTNSTTLELHTATYNASVHSSRLERFYIGEK